ncbi:ABC transporter ATP-binding protein [Legionella impletisoli]|uniref:Glycerol-3-phosphate ABC transporter ATP-binding protein n=1 Tax=Legionella impletisoli TaxID=343510 RepID=A0A917JNK4_9GAMM|nr:sn-glycerol-3-phosphate ABC transporter ATP-binding protein UgpC [Legionella impletisoli]GGI75637.1 glycerol-3-phosphate ABC transporter ATP-binding protein [Legionella impletisoli]
MATVNIDSVSKRYHDTIILNNINLNIEKGEFVALVGPSGSGKSTLLRLVAGLDTVSEGSILINDQCVNEIPPSKRNMAMVFQSYALYPHMTVFSNMAYGLKMRGMNKKAIQQRVEEVSDLLQIRPYLYRKPMALSGGQRQRVAMGRAIVRDPAVFLFDEPLSNLDSKLRTEMRHELKKLHQKLNTTCLYVTHDQTEAMTLADRIVLLNQGNIEQVGTPQELYQKPSSMFVAGFIGNYPMNFIPATIDESQNIIKTEIGTEHPIPSLKRSPQKEDELIVGVRPEHFEQLQDDVAMGIKTRVQFMDDMGSDILLQVTSEIGDFPLSIRLLDRLPENKKKLTLGINLNKASLFCKKSGLRLGGWDE